jgi:ATP-dependent 26S proteasome regulatory subunit
MFFDEIDAIGGAPFDDGAGGDNEVYRTMLELSNLLDRFDPRGNIKVKMNCLHYSCFVVLILKAYFAYFRS